MNTRINTRINTRNATTVSAWQRFLLDNLIMSEHWALPPIEAYANGVSQYASLRWTAEHSAAQHDTLIEELPVSLEFSGQTTGQTAIVMMATPTDLEAFALGFALTEGIIDHPKQMLELHAVPAECGMAVMMTVADDCMARVQTRQRNQAATSSCSLCGLADMQAALHAPTVTPSEIRFNPAAITVAFQTLPNLQTIGQQTGSAHAAAFVSPQGTILAIAEDAGRHNAIDKLVGKMVQTGLQPQDGFCAITSRASFEVVQKAARVGFPLLAAISAPTALAVRLAKESGITLCAFVRGERLTSFSHTNRLSV